MNTADSHTIRVGLLLCDHLDAEVQAEHGDYTEIFPNAFAHTDIEFRIYDVINGELPDSVSEQDAWMVSGSRHSAYDDLHWITSLKDFLTRVIDARHALVGICFGHQLIAIVLGGHVAKAEIGWGVGRKSFDIVQRPEWLEKTGLSELVMYMSHQDQVLELPADASLVAAADYCPNAAYIVGSQIFCVQGHPEFNPGVLGTLVKRRRHILGNDLTDTALQSMQIPVDRRVVPDLIELFLRDSSAKATQ